MFVLFNKHKIFDILKSILPGSFFIFEFLFQLQICKNVVLFALNLEVIVICSFL